MHGQPITALSGTYSFLGLQTKGACERGAAIGGCLPALEMAEILEMEKESRQKNNPLKRSEIAMIIFCL